MHQKSNLNTHIMKKNRYIAIPHYIPVRVIKLLVEQLREMGFYCAHFEYVIRVDHISPRQQFDIEHIVSLLGLVYKDR